MTHHRWLARAVLLLCAICSETHATSEPASAEAAADALQARISRVEQGLSTRVVVKGASNRTMALTERMAIHQVPAVSIALVNDGRIEWARAYGVTDAARQRAATTATLFQAGSISKSVAALGALRLIEQGKLSLDGDANRQLAAWKIPPNAFTERRAVSLRQLLNHSAGMTVHGFGGYPLGQPLPTLLQVLDGAPPANSAAVRVDVEPGSLWRYSGGGYSIVQLMVTEASGQSFDRYMDAAVLEPVGMSASTFVAPLPRNRRDQVATAYDARGQAIAGKWHVYPESAAAGLWSTPSDLARLVLEVQEAEVGRSENVVSRAMAELMLTRGLGEYGLGFFVENLGDRISFSHGGGTEGFRAQLYGYTRSGQGVVVMTNSDNGSALIDEILSSIAAEYGWPEFQVVEKTAIPGDAAVNRQVAGEYRLANQPARIVAESDRLYFQSELFSPRRMELFRESAKTFFMTAEDMTIRFSYGGDGVVTGFDLIRGATTHAASRTP